MHTHIHTYTQMHTHHTYTHKHTHIHTHANTHTEASILGPNGELKSEGLTEKDLIYISELMERPIDPLDCDVDPESKDDPINEIDLTVSSAANC